MFGLLPPPVNPPAVHEHVQDETATASPQQEVRWGQNKGVYLRSNEHFFRGGLLELPPVLRTELSVFA